MKTFLKYTGSILGLLLLIGLGLYTNVIKLPITQNMHASWPYDYGNNHVLFKYSDSIFIGKIIKQVGTESPYSFPQTQFEVEVISNIKGDLNGTVIVNQQGGYEYGVLHVMEGDIMVPGEEKEEYLLQPGQTYFMATRRSQKNPWYYLNSHTNARKTISQDKNVSREELLTLIEQDEKVQDFRAVKQSYDDGTHDFGRY